MNNNDEDIDLRLALGSRKYSVTTRLKSSSGAGVNANSRVHMPFAASDDPLSELVWSPHNGLSLKCANTSFADSKPFLTWDVRESTNENLTSQDIRLENGDINISAGVKLSVSQSMLDEAGHSGNRATVCRSSGGSSSSGLLEKKNLMNYVLGGSKGLTDKAITADAVQEEHHRGNVDEDLCSPQNVNTAQTSKINAEPGYVADAACDRKSDTAVNWKFPSNLDRRRRFNHKGRLKTHATRSGVVQLAVPIRSEPPMARVSEALVYSLPNMQAHEQLDDEVTSASTDANKTKTDAALSSPDGTLMKLESSAENDVGRLVAKESRSLGEMELPRTNCLPIDLAPTDSRICLYREKGKEKALSDGGIYGRSSNDKDYSHESVESCNSSRLFAKGVKRQHYDQGQIVESKRMKTGLQGSPGSTSVHKPDSSFMNWMSNMVKGLADSNKLESSLVALALPHSNNVCGNNHQESFKCNKATDFAKPTTGFQNVFQSLYCQTNKTTPISGVQKDNQFIAESSALMVPKKNSLDNTPQPCNRNMDKSCKQIIVSDQEGRPHISTSPIKPWIFSADFATGSSFQMSLAENKAVDIPECSKEINEGKSSGSFCKKVVSTAEKMDIDIPLPVSCVPEKSKPLSSLWITRLYTRNAQFENCNGITDEALDCNSERRRANDSSCANDVFSIGQKTSEARDDSNGVMQSFSPKESIDLMASHKKSLIRPFQELRSSEAMASLFAKRLDALRHIIHSSGKREPPSFSPTCFFCGNSGHDLRKCPELTETELENLLLNISSFNRVDESPCMCIRCFQADHWAISCPLASSLGHRKSMQNAGAIEQQTTDNKCSSYVGGKEDNHINVPANQADHCKKQLLGSFPNFLAWNMKESSSKRLSTSNELQKSSLSNLGSHLKEKIDSQIAVPQEEMFHAIRKLRLSRADILRWMDSDVSLSHLSGFFLRLRLGKLEGGLGGTGYYVACITGDSMENIGCNSKKSVLVDVGGMKSSVGSQYISNQDFLEDEIKGWWSRIVKSGGKIPCLDELNSKFETRECLGI